MIGCALGDSVSSWICEMHHSIQLCMDRYTVHRPCIHLSVLAQKMLRLLPLRQKLCLEVCICIVHVIKSPDSSVSSNICGSSLLRSSTSKLVKFLQLTGRHQFGSWWISVWSKHHMLGRKMHSVSTHAPRHPSHTCILSFVLFRGNVWENSSRWLHRSNTFFFFFCQKCLFLISLQFPLHCTTISLKEHSGRD